MKRALVNAHLTAWLIDKGFLPEPKPTTIEAPHKEWYKVNRALYLAKDPEIVAQHKRPEKARVCQAAGVGDIPCADRKLCKAHIITRKFNSIRAAEENILWLCKDHEAYFNNRDIRVWFNWVRINYPEKFKFVEREFEFIMNEYEEFLKVAYARKRDILPVDTPVVNSLSSK